MNISWWDRLRFVYRDKDLLLSDENFRSNSSGHNFYESTGDGPQFLLRQVLPAGWYMLELDVHSDRGTGYARFYLNQSKENSEARFFGLPYRNGKIFKRLLYLPAPGILRFEPVTESGLFELRHFRLVRMTRRAALKRVNRKLLNHRRLGARDCIAPQDFATDWTIYDSLFAPDSSILTSYAQWIELVEKPLISDLTQHRKAIQNWVLQPLVSIILPTWNTPVALLQACIESVHAQTYPHWELSIADDASTQPQVRQLLDAWARQDHRIRVQYLSQKGHICEASNAALKMAQGEFVALLDHDDTLAPHALFFMLAALQSHPQAQLIYSDEDKLDPEGRRCDPFFKPDWSPDLLLSQNYICHFTMLSRALMFKVGGFRQGYEGSQDYDLLLRCTEQLKTPSQIVHVPMVLYHWRQSDGSTASGHQAKDYATEAALRSLRDHMNRIQNGAQVSVIAPGLYRAHWPLPADPPLVSLIIPTRDGIDVLRICIESILQKTTYPHIELLLVNNQSTCSETLAYLDELAAHPQGNVRVLIHDQPFNYSAINNMAALHARGCVLGFINNDVEVINPEWLNELVSHALRPDVGCVGAKLYYPDRTVQHAGVVLGIGGVAGHSHKYFPHYADGYFGRLRICHNVSAVTGAVMVLRKDVYDEIGGLNEENLAVTFNDVDLCLRVNRAGYRHVWTPFAELYHHESKTRGSDDTLYKKARFARERDYMITTWGNSLQHDPYYNPNLTLVHENYGLHAGENRHQQLNLFEHV